MTPPAVGFVGTIGSWFLMLRFGRRPIYVQGLGALIVLQLIIGILDCVPGRPSGVAWAESTLMLIWNFAYDLSIGPVCFTLLGECSAARVRSKTIAVATAAQGVLGIAMTVAIPYMINPDQVRSMVCCLMKRSILKKMGTGQYARKAWFLFRGTCSVVLRVGILPRPRDTRPFI
jgi:hypothetical protein